MIRLILALLLLAAPARAAERVVSLNLCTDQLLVELAPEKIAALTMLSRDPSISWVAARAAHLPVVRADAEAILRLHPDLVLATPVGAQETIALLKARGIPVLSVDLPEDFAGIRAEIRKVAAALAVPARGEALIARMDQQLASVRKPGHPIHALLWEPRGWTVGPGTLGDAVLRAAGLTDTGTGRQLGLEALLAHPPDLLVVPQAPRFPSLATNLLRHPALAGIPRRTIPPALLICGGPQTALAVEALAH